VLDGEMRELLESGCSLSVGLLGAGGVPFATRAWAFDVLDAEVDTARLLLGAGELARSGRSWDELVGGGIGVTAADVTTLQSVQVKGAIEEVAPATAADVERAARHCDAFFSAVTEIDLTPRQVLDRLVPVDLVAARIRVDEVYDQTPGPAAGTPLGRPG
jgi:hypothetical protein